MEGQLSPPAEKFFFVAIKVRQFWDEGFPNIWGRGLDSGRRFELWQLREGGGIAFCLLGS